MSGIRSSLARHAATGSEPEPGQGFRAARAAWREHGIVLLNPDEIERRHGWAAAQEVRNLGIRYFGKRSA